MTDGASESSRNVDDSDMSEDEATRSLAEQRGEGIDPSAVSEGTSSDPIPSDMRTLIDQMKPGERTVIERAFGMVMGQARPPIYEKLTEDHVSEMIASRREEAWQNHERWKIGHFTNAGIIVLMAITATGLIVFAVLVDAKDLIARIVTGFLGLGSGFAAGRQTK